MGNIFSFELMCCDKITSGCWDCVAGQAIYTYQLEESLSELKTALDELKEQRADVIRKVNIAEQQFDQRIIDGKKEMKNLCMEGCCSMNYRSTLKFSKTVVKRLHDVKVLKRKGAFEVVAMEVPAALAVERPCDSSVGMESMLNKVWSILEEKHARIVGIYGVGGVGKTRILTEINNKISVPSNGFDMVIWVMVSKGFRIAKVQDDIAKRIGLFSGMWGEKSVEEKAMDIFRVLREKKFVVLMDDVWERVDILKVGIPLPTYENGSKIIFTTRSNEVCGQMRAHKKIEVQCLTEEQAWELFEHVGNDILDGHPNIRDLAHEVARECGGLPLALITIGRAMACKRTPEEWEYAIQVLKRSANSVFPDMDEVVYPLLKFSFDCLPNDLVRCCLLYCSLFPEDYRIPKEIFIDCCIVEGFMDEYESISQARKQGHHIIEVSDSTVKMHDVIRDMCLWIACRLYAHKWKFFVRAGYELTQVPEVGKWRGIKRMSLMQNKIEALNEPPYCPDLQTLFLNQNQLKVIHNDFFQFMSGLKILCFRANRGIRELPVGISKLVSLEYLDFSYTGIRQLPTELKALEKLKCLKLEYLLDGIRIPRGLISGFSKLQMLKMMGSFLFNKSAAKDNHECLVEEMQSLNNLNELSMSVTSAFALERLMSAEMLHTCTEQIGLHSFRDSKQLNILSLANFKCLNYIQISKCESLEEVKTEMDITRAKAPNQTQIPVVEHQMCFQSLVKVYISGCSTLRDITWLILAQNLRHFIVINCHKMEEIINEIKLSQIAEMYLPELKSIYKDALPFSCMKDIHVYAWPKLTRLPLNSDSAKRNEIRIHGKEKWWKEMHWEDESTRNAFLPCFIAEKVTFLSFCFVLEKHVDLKQGNHSCSYPLTCLTWLTEDEEPSERTITYCSKSADSRRL
ncbi:hypothetical protein ES332_A10G087300v1 [Gossypium tomentosum]|uniref:Uncharacterized protein n=1 Tax=Gossypium tomentosum TaxID=34277 RepID=A0A5D2NNR6_GOSTO|nr:hypothetical protein ES332_A10G087300v1 [Gossypium tomentosum]